MAEYIDRQAALEILTQYDRAHIKQKGKPILGIASMVVDIEDIPAADVREVVKAKWEDVHIDRPEIADLEVASMFCPNCNRWHNEVYHYGNPIEFANYCQFCGADMREES